VAQHQQRGVGKVFALHTNGLAESPAARKPACDVTQKGVLPKERPEKAPVDSKVVLPKAP
jgi:hypothetical protein